MPISSGVYSIQLAGQNSYVQVNGDSPVSLSSVRSGNQNQKWKVTQVEGSENSYRITSPDGMRTLTHGSGGTHDFYGHGYLKCKADAENTNWVIEESEKGCRISLEGADPGLCIDSDYKQGTVYPWIESERSDSQYWKFEPAGQAKTGSFEQNFFTMTVEEAANLPPDEEPDFIIIGSGIGGGVVMNDLYDTNWKLGRSKRILVLEKGGLVFHSHCLNTARPSGLANDRGQQNDSFFHKFKQDFNFDPSVDTNDWKGGAMYNLGGRSAAWGLFAPRVHDEVINKELPPSIAEEMNEYYRKAERLMMISTPETKRIHQHIMDRLNIHGTLADGESNVQWQWGRIASEFRDERNYDFAEGAYSTIDKMLEIAMSKPETGEHKDIKIVLNADVRSLTFDPVSEGKRAVNGVVVKDCNGDHHCIKVKTGGKVILCAGSVESPAILLRTPEIGYDTLRKNRGLHLTDHDILFYTRSFRYIDPKLREEYGAMKLQSYARFGKAGLTRCLLNMSLDASSFLPRGASPDDSLSQFIFVVMNQSHLAPDSNIQLDPSPGESVVKLCSGGSEVKMICGEPKVTIVRGDEADDDQEEAMKRLVAASMDGLVEGAKIEFDGFDSKKKVPSDAIHLKTLQLGGVAHELGTLPIDTSKNKNGKIGCVDDNLQFLPDKYQGLYVCDLSVFPWSPAANPTLTLAAFACRLSRHLLSRDSCVEKGGQVHHATVEEGKICVVNHSGAKIKVWLTHAHPRGQDAEKPPQGKGPQAGENDIIEPGESLTWDQDVGEVHGLFVYQLDLVMQHRLDEWKQEREEEAVDQKAWESAEGRKKVSIARRMEKRKVRIATAEQLLAPEVVHAMTSPESKIRLKPQFVTTPVLVQVKPGINSIQHDARDGVTVVYRGAKEDKA